MKKTSCPTHPNTVGQDLVLNRIRSKGQWIIGDKRGISANLKLLLGKAQLLCKIRPELLWQSMPLGFSLPVLRLFQEDVARSGTFHDQSENSNTQCGWVDKSIQVHEIPLHVSCPM